MGRALRGYLPDAVFLGRDELDVRDAEQCERVILKHQPTHVLHAAAITDHQCPDIGLLIDTNIIGTQNVVMGAEQVGAKLVFLSTHYVYPGQIGGYIEQSKCGPIGSYAWTKYAAERIVNAYNHDILVIRGSWVTHEKFVRWQGVGALIDAYTNRETVDAAAEKIAALVLRDASGVVNIGGERRSFWHLAKDEGYACVPISRAQLDPQLPYPFPPDCSVNTDRYRSLVV